MLQATGEGGGPGWAGWVVGLLVLTLMGALIALGVRRRARRVRRLVWALMGGHGLVFGLLMLAARAYEAGEAAGFGGFPAPTAWLIYGIGLFPVLLLALMVRRFETAFFDDADQARFDEILRRAAADGSSGPAPDDSGGPAPGGSFGPASARASGAGPPGGRSDAGDGAPSP